MKTPLLAGLIAATAIGAVAVTAFPTIAREEPPHYDLLFAFRAEKSVSVDVTPHDTFHVVTRDGSVQFPATMRGQMLCAVCFQNLLKT